LPLPHTLSQKTIENAISGKFCSKKKIFFWYVAPFIVSDEHGRFEFAHCLHFVAIFAL
jgi:hypothetical protein